ncbi:unnamed protein product [Dicrocoelium dendriticum]|nr:unnamed protein product [Dicrocoelium dendriticum]
MQSSSTARPFTLRDFLVLSDPKSTGGVSYNTANSSHAFNTPYTNPTFSIAPTYALQTEFPNRSHPHLGYPEKFTPLPHHTSTSVSSDKMCIPMRMGSIKMGTDSSAGQFRPPLRRSNTVGANELEERLRRVNSVAYSFQGGSYTHSRPSFSWMQPHAQHTNRQFSEDRYVAHMVQEVPSSQDLLKQLLLRGKQVGVDIALPHNALTHVGQSPTERVMRRLGTMNTSSLDRNAQPSDAMNQVERLRGTGPMDRIEYPASSMAAKGSGVPSGSLNAPISRRARLRRECTVESTSQSSAIKARFAGYGQYCQDVGSIGTAQPGNSLDRMDSSANYANFEPRDLKQNNTQWLEVPEELRFTTDRFLGRTLVHWLCSHLARNGLSWTHNLITSVTHICDCLLRLGILQPEWSRSLRTPYVFNDERDRDAMSMYRLPSTESTPRGNGIGPAQNSSLSAKYPQEDQFDLQIHYIWTGNQLAKRLELQMLTSRSADAESAARRNHGPSSAYARASSDVSSLRREYEYELERLTREHELQLFRVKNQGVMKVCQLTDRIESLEQEVEKYRILAGIEHLTKSPMLDEPSTHPRSSKTRGPMLSAQTQPENTTVEEKKRSPLETKKSRLPRVGFSVPETIELSPKQSTSTRPRASSEVSMTTSSSADVMGKWSGIVSSNTQREQSRPSMKYVADVPADELPRTKGFLRRLRQMSSVGTDSGISGSRSSAAYSGTSSQDTTQQSASSVEFEEIIGVEDTQPENGRTRNQMEQPNDSNSTKGVGTKHTTRSVTSAAAAASDHAAKTKPPSVTRTTSNNEQQDFVQRALKQSQRVFSMKKSA